MQLVFSCRDNDANVESVANLYILLCVNREVFSGSNESGTKLSTDCKPIIYP